MFFQAHLKVECIPEIREIRPDAWDNIMLADASGFAQKLVAPARGTDWDRLEREKYKAGLVDGDLSLVAQSDQMLLELEERLITSRTFVNVANCVGALPIVPAFIAGQSNNMRLRLRKKKPAGPLAIFLETTGSGSISSRNASWRGSAMLALVRKLSEYRPVELWCCVTYGWTERMNGLLVKIETTPLDLARSAHMLCNLGTTASFGHNVIADVIGEAPGSWSYGESRLERTWCGEIFKRFLAPGSDVLYVPAAFTHDASLADPCQWLQEMLTKYGGETVEREED